MDAQELMRFASALANETLTTDARGAAFPVKSLASGIEFTPFSSGETRLVPREKLDEACPAFERSGSFRTGDYQSMTFDSLYLLA